MKDVEEGKSRRAIPVLDDYVDQSDPNRTYGMATVNSTDDRILERLIIRERKSVRDYVRSRTRVEKPKVII